MCYIVQRAKKLFLWKLFLEEKSFLENNFSPKILNQNWIFFIICFQGPFYYLRGFERKEPFIFSGDRMSIFYVERTAVHQPSSEIVLGEKHVQSINKANVCRCPILNIKGVSNMVFVVRCSWYQCAEEVNPWQYLK